MRVRLGAFFSLFHPALCGLRTSIRSVDPYSAGSKRDSGCFISYRIRLITILTSILLTALPAIAQLDMNHDTGVKLRKPMTMPMRLSI